MSDTPDPRPVSPDPKSHTPDPAQHSLLRRFRSDAKQRLPLHPLERAVLTVVALHLCFLPWALGTMHPWSQITSLSLSLLTFTLALIPRTYSGDYGLAVAGLPAIGSAAAGRQSPVGSPQPTVHSPPSTVYRLNPWPRLVRFPLFWIGLLLLAYIAIQGYNPSWVWERNATHWWLRRVTDIPWLPTSIDAPFERFNLWRQFIIYGSAWLTVCAVWVGFTRRRSLEVLLMILAVNGGLFAATGFVIRMFRSWDYLLWYPEPREGVTSFASFIYKNHAGAWLSLMAFVFLFLAVARHLRSIERMERSSPAALLMLGTLLMFFAVVFTYSRGGMIILAAFLFLALVVYFLHRLLTKRESTTHPLVSVSVGLMVALTLGYSASLLDFQRLERRFERLLAGGTKDQSLVYRASALKAAVTMFETNWQRGVGAGGFRYLYPEYVKRHPAAYKGGRLYWEHAHNDWLQIPIELGAGGAGLLLLGGLWWLAGIFRRHIWRNLPVLLLCLGLTQTLLHAVFDFPFQNPAVLITWLVLAIVALRRLQLEGA